MPELGDVLLLCLAAGFAGWVDAVSGGGGLVQIPALLILLPGRVAGAGAGDQQAVEHLRHVGLCGDVLPTRCGPTCAPLCRWRASRWSAPRSARCVRRLISVEVFRPLVLVLVVLVAAYVLLHPTGR